MFFGQKLKCDFFKEKDRGTFFFHSVMSQKHNRNFILVIHRSNGLLTTSAGEVGAEFLSFFHNLYGTSKVTLSQDREIVNSGPCISFNAHNLLLDPVSNDDIKNALFGIRNDKAPIQMVTHPSSSKVLGWLGGRISVLCFKISCNKGASKVNKSLSHNLGPKIYKFFLC